MAVLTLYGSSIADGTLTTACDCSSGSTGGTETSKVTTCSGANDICEVWSQGGTATDVTSIPATPTGHGWLFKPGIGGFEQASWSATVTFAASSLSTASLTLRFFKYSSVGGTYTSIGTITKSSVTATKTALSFAATEMNSYNFLSTDYVYIDLFLTNSASLSGKTLTVYVSNSSSQGVANDFVITTSFWTPALSSAWISYKNTILNDPNGAPIRYYRLNDASLTNGSSAVDLGSQAHNGTYTSTGMTSASGLVRGDSTSGAVTFPSSGTNHITMPTTGLPTGKTAFSVEVWVKTPSTLPTTNDPVIVMFGTAQNGELGLYLAYATGTTPPTFFFGTWGTGLAGTYPIAASTVYHLVGTWDGTTGNLYMNATWQGSGTDASMNITASVANIGGDGVAGYYWSGEIGDVSLWNYALSQTQVSTHYEAGLAMFKSTNTRLLLMVQKDSSTGARTRLSVAKKVVANSRLLVSVSKKISNGSRFLLSVGKKVSTNARLLLSPKRSQSTNSRVRIMVSKVVSLGARLQLSIITAVSRSMNSRLLLSVRKLVSTGTRLLLRIPIVRSTNARFLLFVTRTLSLSTRLLLAIAKKVSANARLRLAIGKLQSLGTRFELASSIKKAVSARVLLQVKKLVSAGARFFLVIPGVRSTSGRVRVMIKKLVSTGGRLSLSVSQKNSAPTRFRMMIARTLSSGMRLFLVIPGVRSTNARLRLAVGKVISLGARLRLSLGRKLSAPTRLLVSIGKQIATQSRIRIQVAKDLAAQSRFRLFVGKVISTGARARISLAHILSVGSRARIAVGKLTSLGARLKLFSTKDVSTPGRIRIAARKLVSLGTRILLTTHFSRSVGGRIRIWVLSHKGSACRLVLLPPIIPPVPFPGKFAGLGVLPLTTPPVLPYAVNGTTLDNQPTLMTAPVSTSTTISAGTSFFLGFTNPSTMVQNLFASGATLTLQFGLTDGSSRTALVSIQSQFSGSFFLVTATLIQNSSAYWWVLPIQAS